jgi:uncharacterized protein YbjT (DUF2867 family)
LTKRILVTGATGYVGGRLLRVLLERGYDVRALARRPQSLKPAAGFRAEIVRGDVLDKSSLVRAMQGVDTAYYMVHSMGSTLDFVELDRAGARNFGEAAQECGVRRIIYLGGLGKGGQLSPHLQSRQEVGDILRRSGVQIIELRASIVIGSGSLSFEMIRALVERLPIMITPRWVGVETQPVAISDLLEYLLEALEIQEQSSSCFEIGGPERVSYGQLMKEYARQRHLRRLMIPVPVLTPRLSSLWLGLVTPLYARTGRKLIESLRHPTIVSDSSGGSPFVVRPRGVRQAIAEALTDEDRGFSESPWSDPALPSSGVSRATNIRLGNRLVDTRSAIVHALPPDAFRPIQRIGGATGWYYANWLWRLRGLLDLLFGGVGMKRARKHPDHIAEGDAIDWWRVEAFESDRYLRLAAEMKLPGRAWLEFVVERCGEDSVIKQTAIFDPVGLWGLVYWYSIYPLHTLVFKGMLAALVRQAQTPQHAETPAPAGFSVQVP